MLAIELAFPGNRYHATPWNRHVNEGQVEWPPSPWRILRALMATWALKARHDIDESALTEILERLASDLPIYHIPLSVAAHARYYYPAADGGNPAKTFDAFLRLAPDATLRIEWPNVDLATELRDHVAALLARIGYLGRVESLIDAKLVTTTVGDGDDRLLVIPQRVDSGTGASAGETIELLAPMAPDVLTHWRQGVVEQRMADALRAQNARAKKPKSLSTKKKREIQDSVPASVFSVLAVETRRVQKLGWNRPPGSRWVTYASERRLTSVRVTRLPRTRRPRRPTTARLAVTSKLAPQITDAIFVTETLRQQLITKSNGAAVFSGHDSAQKPQQGHSHTFILPEANSSSQRITHITLFAAAGFAKSERAAIEKLSSLYLKDSAVTVVLLDLGHAETFAGLDIAAGACPLLATSNTWISHTPFVATRHPKRYRDKRPKLDEHGRQIGSPEHDLRRLLKANGHPDPLVVEAIPEALIAGRSVQWSRFRTRRRGGSGARGNHPGCGFRLVFDEPRTGPLAFGYGAHFGLGVFKAEQY